MHGVVTVWPLTGGGEELRIVADAVAARRCSGVVVAGPAGVGKTRLAREALGAGARGGAVTRWAVATASAASIPFGALTPCRPWQRQHRRTRLSGYARRARRWWRPPGGSASRSGR